MGSVPTEADEQKYRREGDYASGPAELPLPPDDMPAVLPVEPMPVLGKDDTKPDPGDDPDWDVAKAKAEAEAAEEATGGGA